MVISSLVVTLSQEPAARARALAMLAGDQRLLIGTAVRDRLPVVAESASAGVGEALCEDLAARDGIVRVDVIAIDFSEDQ